MHSRKRIVLGLTIGIGFLASCGFLRSVFNGDGPAPRPFNHEAHTVRGISCADCHETAEKDVRAGMPSREFCMTCHDDLDKDPAKPLEKKVAWFLDPAGNPLWSSFTKQSGDVKFSHKSHAGAKVECATCHSGIDKNTGLVPGMVQRMSSCTECHAKAAPKKNDCATCHTRQDRELPPRNHLLAWVKMHGPCSRDGREVSTSNDCAMCHKKDSCTNCHQTRPPEDHNAHWRLRGHCTAAGVDRARCQVCHTSDSCTRCHLETSPRSHTAGWNAPTNRHCVSCHTPVQTSTGCATCHKSTPGHLSASAKPAWHTPAMDCRSCHAATLKHFDNGDNCNACHR